MTTAPTYPSDGAAPEGVVPPPYEPVRPTQPPTEPEPEGMTTQQKTTVVIIAIVAILLFIGLIAWLWRLKPENSWLAVALALILAGAVGNLIDRAWLGQVIDFIQVYYDRWYFPVFNVADISINIGAALLVMDSLLRRNA